MPKLDFRSLLQNIGDKFSNVDNPNSLSNKFWNSKAGSNLVGWQEFLNDPKSQIKIGPDFQPKIGDTEFKSTAKVAGNVIKSGVEEIATQVPKVFSDVGKVIHGVATGNTNDVTLTSKPAIFGEDIMTYFVRDDKGNVIRKPFDNVSYKGQGKWTVPFTNVRFPEFNITESSAYSTASKALDAAGMPLAAYGLSNPIGMLKMLGFNSIFGGVINSATSGFEEGSFDKGFWGTAYGTAPDLAKSYGLLKATDKFTRVGKLPVKSTANVLQGIMYDEVSGNETNGASILIDAMFPVAEDLSSKAFSSLDEAVRTIQGKIIDKIGKGVRKSDGTYTDLKRFVEQTRPYKHRTKGKNNMFGAFMGFEIYEDEDGKIRVKFNSKKAALGILILGGFPLKSEDLDDLEGIMEAEKYKGMDLDNPNGVETPQSIKNDIYKSLEKVKKSTGKKVDISNKSYDDLDREVETSKFKERLGIQKTQGENIAEEWKNKLNELKQSRTPQDSARVRKELEELDKIRKRNEISRKRTEKARKYSKIAMDYKARADRAYADGNKKLGDKYYQKYIDAKNTADIEYKWSEKFENESPEQIRNEIPIKEKIDVNKIPDEQKQQEVYGTAGILSNVKEEASKTFSDIQKRTIFVNSLKEFERSNINTKVLSYVLQNKYNIETIVDYIEGRKSYSPELESLVSKLRNDFKEIREAEIKSGIAPDIASNEEYVSHLSDAQVYASNLSRKLLNTKFGTRSQTLMEIYNPLKARTNKDWIGDADIWDRLNERFARASEGIINQTIKLDPNKSYLEQIQEGVKPEDRIPFDKKIGIGQKLFKKNTWIQRFITSGLENSIEGWRDLGPDVFNMVQDLKYAMTSNGAYKSNLVDVYKSNPQDPLPFILKMTEDLGFKQGTKEFSDFYGDVAKKFNRTKDPEARERLAWGIANEVANARLNKQIVRVENWARNVDIKDGITRDFVDRELMNIFTNGSKTMSQLEEFVDYTRRYIQTANIGGKITTTIMQPLEVLRAIPRYGPKNTIKAVYDTFFNKNAINYRFIKDYSNMMQYMTTDGTKIEKSKVDKALQGLEKAGYFGMGKLEDWKNDVYLRAAELEGSKKGLEGDELGRFIMDEFEKYSLNFSNTSVPALLRNPFMKFFSMYSTYPTKQLGLMLRSMEDALVSKEGLKSKDAQFLVGMLFTTWVTKKVFGWMFGNEEDDLFADYGYFDMLLGSPPQGYNSLFDTIKSYGEFNEAKRTSSPGEYDYEKAKQTLTRNLNKTIVPYGNQLLNTTFATVGDISRGYAETPTGNVKYPAPSKPMDIVKSLLFSRYSNEEAKNYFNGVEKGINMALTKEESEFYKQELLNGGNPRRIYDMFINKKIETKEENKILKNVKSTKEDVISNGKIYFWNDEKQDSDYVEINKDLSVPKLTNNKELNDEILIDYNSKLTSRKNDIMKLYYKGYITEDIAVSKITQIDMIKEWISEMTKEQKISKPSFKKGGNIDIPKVASINGVKTNIRNIPSKKISIKTEISKIPNLEPLSELVLDSVEGMKKFVDKRLSEIDNNIKSSYKFEPLEGI